ncbi:CDP-diacylglycerol--glycerol-3-phosphate 3-phosphatidyltransferase [Rhodococcus sp. NPDC058505]|uniref:CDP-diacylglycerol--glycerol-3-phosphate 3-phosphatidyltransferase n=1 Tax=Rhodococcus sp. NPDC058505 TaxID=3346531 RepID=UPI00364DB79B
MTAQQRASDGLAVSSTEGSDAAAGRPVPVLNIANVLTMLRILLVPVFLLLLFVGDGHETPWRIAAAAVFAIAAITDRIDGQVARKYGLVTDFGKLADPIADKALIGAALVGLSILGDLSWWVTGVIAAREIGVTVLRFAVLRHGVIPASRGGKVKTLVQSVAIGLYLLPLSGAVATAAAVLMGAAVLLTVVTGLDYVIQSIRLRADVHTRHPAP